MQRTKIVDTIGPASSSPEILRELALIGMNVARINRSHGTLEECEVIYRNIREAADDVERNVAVLVDLQGPKIRCGWFEKNADGKDVAELEEGQKFTITTDEIMGNKERVSTTFKGLPGDCKPGDTILIDDGKIRLRVESVEGNDVNTVVVVPGPISSHKGINLPGVAVSIPALTEKDEEDLRWAVRIGADIIAMSFVRFASDIERAHEIMDEEGRRVPIIAKIEKPQAVDNLEEIIAAFDGIMVARGDLAVEMPYESVPLIAKRCIKLARQHGGKPVIVATEVLGSMVHSPVPTRAEASDCANAVLDGADATMTSNETAVGEYPVESVKTMLDIATYTTDNGYDQIPVVRPDDNGYVTSITSAAVDLAEHIDAKAIVVFAKSGSSVRHLSAFRSQIPIYAITHDFHTKCFMGLSWGVEVYPIEKDHHGMSRLEMMSLADSVLKKEDKLHDGEQVVLMCCSPEESGLGGKIDSIFVHIVGNEV